MLSVTYLLYIILYETLILGGTGYVVFCLDASGWWFVLAFIASWCVFEPREWGEMYFNHPDTESTEK